MRHLLEKGFKYAEDFKMTQLYFLGKCKKPRILLGKIKHVVALWSVEMFVSYVNTSELSSL